MNADWKEEKKISVNPSWVIQSLVGLVLIIGGWSINRTLDNVGTDINEVKSELQSSRLERSQIRADMTALEIGLRGDRFTRTDWIRENSRIEKELTGIQDQIREIELKQKNGK